VCRFRSRCNLERCKEVRTQVSPIQHLRTSSKIRLRYRRDSDDNNRHRRRLLRLSSSPSSGKGGEENINGEHNLLLLAKRLAELNESELYTGRSERAIDAVVDEDFALDLAFDRDTQNVSGAPNVAATILEKIDQASVLSPTFRSSIPGTGAKRTHSKGIRSGHICHASH
jgi:hypothetical protein